MHFDAEFFVAVAFVLFLCTLGYFGLHTTIIGALDSRRNLIAKELAEAKRLRDEAAAVLASYEKKRAAAEGEAQAIIAQARAEAESMAKEAGERMNEFVARRTKQAEAKIAMAEQQATADVRAAAADAAVKAAETVLRNEVRGQTASDLVMSEITALKGRLN
jgi:F-type H+-transporting ATPase subunit b